MDDLEDGELPSSPEVKGDDSDPETAPYTPLIRPDVSTAPRPRSATNSSMVAHAGDLDTRDRDESQFRPGFRLGERSMSAAAARPATSSSDQSGSSASDSDSDGDLSQVGSRFSAKKKKAKLCRPCAPSSQDHGQTFSAMARQYQSNRKMGSNNVWGSILQEDALNSELKSIGVGQKSLKTLDSDRGAETYDYTLAAEQAKAAESAEAKDQKKNLDNDLKQYWDMETENPDEDRRQDAIRAGKKRSVKDRIGKRKEEDHHFDNLSIPQPGVSREIPDLSSEFLESLKVTAVDDGEEEDGCVSDDDPSESRLLLGEELANRLCEPKTELMVGVVDLIGVDVALELFQKTRHIESGGGMMIKNNARRRTPGGVFLHLLREMGSDPNEKRVDGDKVKTFFAQSNQVVDKRRKRHRRPKSADFMGELEQFKKFSQKKKSKEPSRDCEMSEEPLGDGDLKPLPDILTCITKQIAQDSAEVPTTSSNKSSSKAKNKDLDAFDEPEAPPNSVERPERSISAYEDEFLSTGVETEDIELF